ncbi:MFS transporter [Cohnella sp. CFH 77786]|uniref:MFS transporter n=1 Tax=Cohnella sp. CFH 77786 TaxID=2662265 RepID=UPI001C6107FD|nr:MFS transporter [Cohnella sp. CFH 77786]MBW5445499.1 MFS transporter [Cohnella sp. CFH 77786]
MKKTSSQTYWSTAYFRICICNLFLFTAFQMLLPTLPIYMTDNGNSESAVGWITGLITIAAVLIRPLTGYALDRYRRRMLVIVGSLSLALAAGAFAFSASTGWMATVSLLLGAGWGIMTAAYATIVSDLIPEGRQGAGIGTFMLFGLAAMAVAPFIGGWLIEEYGPPVLFGAASLIAFISLLLFLSGGATERVSRAVPPARDQHGIPNGFFEKSSLFPAMLILLFTIGYGGIISFVSLFGMELGIHNGGIFFLLSNAAAILVRPVAGRAFDKRGHAAVLLPGMVIGILAMVVLSLASGQTLFIIAACLYGLSFGAVQPFILAWTVQRASPDRRGTANSTFLVGMDGGIAIGSIVFGAIAQGWGYIAVFRCSTVLLIALLAIYGASLIRSRKSRALETVNNQREEHKRL